MRTVDSVFSIKYESRIGRSSREAEKGANTGTVFDTKEELKIVSSIEETMNCPPNSCDGYPDPLVIFDVDEISFYISPSTGKKEAEARWFDLDCSNIGAMLSCRCLDDTPLHGGPPSDRNSSEPRLACSLIRSRKKEKKRNGYHSTNYSPLPPENWSTTIDQTKPVIILCHGLLSWRNQWLIHDLAANLARTLNCHTLRFDFTGNGHSSGEWSYSNYDVEFNDLKNVVSYVENEMKCKVVCILGHSKGTFALLRLAWEQENNEQQEQRFQHFTKAPCFVNLAGRFILPDSTSSCLAAFSEEHKTELSEKGSTTWITRGSREFVVTKKAIEERSKCDVSPVSRITSPVLTVHGCADMAVPVENARQFDAVIENHELCIIEGADHNFNGLAYSDNLDAVISDFIRRKGVR